MIEVKNAHKALGEFSLRGVDLCVEKGEYFVVLGPTGAGKTVLLECIAGLYRLDKGEIWIEGRNVTPLAPELRRVGYVPQDYVLFPHMSLARNIGFSLALQGASPEHIEQRVRELAELLHISHLLKRDVRTLSGGEQQRGALARALAPEPTVMLLDEPLSALDEGTRSELSRELRRISEELHTTVIHVCHNFDEALELADRIAIIHQGRIQQVGAPADVFRRPISAFVARFVGVRNLFVVQEAYRHDHCIKLADELVVPVAALPDSPSLLAMIRPEDIQVLNNGEPQARRWHVARIEDRGRFMRLQLVGPLPLEVTMTPQAFAAAHLEEGQAVAVHWPPQALHVLPGEDMNDKK